MLGFFHSERMGELQLGVISVKIKKFSVIFIGTLIDSDFLIGSEVAKPWKARSKPSITASRNPV
jgi:hypothetical protein